MLKSKDETGPAAGGRGGKADPPWAAATGRRRAARADRPSQPLAPRSPPHRRSAPGSQRAERWVRHRHRRRHDRRAQPGRVRRRTADRSRPTGSSRSTTPSRAGSSTTPTRSGRRCARRCSTWSRGWTSRSRPSASPTSARRSWPGTGRPASRTAGPSCGRTGAPPTVATSSQRAGHLQLVRDRTGLVLDPYFSGTKLEWLLPEGAACRSAPTSRSARSTPGSCGT